MIDLMKKELPIILGGVIFVLLVVMVLLGGKKQEIKTSPVERGVHQPTPTAVVYPTKTPEQLETLRKMETKKVSIKDLKFDPQTVTIKVNDQVEWQNDDSVTHNVKGDNWGDFPISPGQKFTQVFDKAGTYSYSCSLHPEMTGTVIVE